MRGRWIYFCFAMVILNSFCQALTRPTFLEIRDWGSGMVLDYPRDISGDGSVIIGGTSAPKKWENNTITILIHSLSPCNAVGISEDGSIIVGYYTSGQGSEAYKWIDGQIYGLGDLPGGTFCSAASAVSSDGSIIVGYSNSSNGNEACYWKDGALFELGDIPGGTFESSALDVSADGSIIVGYGKYDSSQNKEAVRWVNGVLEPLGFLPGGNYSMARAVSADGRVIVGQSNSSTGWYAVRWVDGIIEPLIHPKGANGSEAIGVSADGSIIVGTYYPTYGNPTREPFIWTEKEGMQSLRYILAAKYGIALPGVQLEDATGISDDGRTIIGYGGVAGFMAIITPCLEEVEGDINGDCKVDMNDFMKVAKNWLVGT
jgi:probable HAF family extracellular repeat protein